MSNNKTYKLIDLVKPISLNISDPQKSELKRFVGLEHYDSGEPVIQRFTDTSLLTSSVKEFHKDDILVARRNVYLKRAGIAPFSGLTSGDSIILRVRTDVEKNFNIPHELLVKILPFELNSDVFWAYANKHADGMNSKRISKDTLLDYELSLPDLDKLEVLANKLWAAYRLKESYKKLLIATEDMVKSQFIEMFPGGYPIKKWSECLNIINGKRYDGDYVNTGLYPICGSGGIMGYVNRKSCNRDTIILGRKGNINTPIYMNTDYWIVDTAFCLDVDRNILEPKYFFYWCKMFDFTKYNRQAVLPSLVKSDLLKIEIPIPPLTLQKRFIDIYNKADKSKFVGFKSQFIEMFSSCKNRMKISDICARFIDGDWIESKDQSECGIRLVQTGNVGNGYFKDKAERSRYISEDTFRRLKCTEIFQGDILVSRLPEPIGRACILPSGLGRTITAVDCCIIKLKDFILPNYFISYTMTSEYLAQIKKLETGTTRRRISRTNLGDVLILCPPIYEQEKFVSIAHQADKSKLLS